MLGIIIELDILSSEREAILAVDEVKCKVWYGEKGEGYYLTSRAGKNKNSSTSEHTVTP